MSASPARIICAAIATDLRPEPQSMLIVVAGTSFGMPAGDRGLAGGVLPEAGLQHAAEHDLVDVVAGDPGPLERGPDREGAQLGGGHVLELPPKVPTGVRTALTITASSITTSSNGSMVAAMRAG